MKDFISKIQEKALIVQKSTIDMANNISSVVRQQECITSLKKELSLTEEELFILYAQMGELHYNSSICPNIDASNKMSELFTSIHNAKIKKEELENKIELEENNLKEIKISYEKQKFQDEFDRNKEKLDKALECKVINQEEYDEKLALYTKKLDSFDEIKRIEEQYSMGIISSKEKDEKINKLLND